MWQWRLAAIYFLIFFSMTEAGSRVYAGSGGWNPQHVPVEYTDEIRCTLDATSIKRYTALDGSTFIDVWLCSILNEQARRKAEIIADSQPPTVNYQKLQRISSRCLIQTHASHSGQPPIKLSLSKQYWGEEQLLYEEHVSDQSDGKKWSTLDALEQKALLQLIVQPEYHARQQTDPLWAGTPAMLRANEGLFGIPWGSKPENLPKARLVTAINGLFSVYQLDMSVWPLLGIMRATGGVWLLFSQAEGLVSARIRLDKVSEYAVERQLTERLGPPLMFERIGNDGSVFQSTDSIWHKGTNTRIALQAGIKGVFVDISRRDISSAGGQERFAQTIAAVTEKLALFPLPESSTAAQLTDGAAGLKWGTPAEQVNSQIPVASMNLGETVLLFTDKSMGHFMQNIRPIGPSILIFNEQQGLVGASCRIDRQDYLPLYQQLKFMLGDPHSEKGSTISWWTGNNTVITLDYDQNGKTAAVTAARRDFYYQDQLLFRYL